jgi:hypothetical protein
MRGPKVEAAPDSDPTIQEEIRAAARQLGAGDVAGARAALESIGLRAEQGSAFDWLFFAHSFADVQSDLSEELRWDLTALEAVGGLSEAEVAEEGVPGGKAGLLPSLHLNLSDVYRRLGDEAQAQHHYNLGAAHLVALDDSGYGDSIREAFERFVSHSPAAD